MDPDTQEQDPILEKNIKEVLAALPPAIRRYIADQKHEPVVQSLVAKYRLHMDQGTTLEKNVLFLLMGIQTPEHFSAALTKELGLDRATVSGIIQEVNTKIFAPLRDEMQQGNVKPGAPAPEQKPSGPTAARTIPLPASLGGSPAVKPPPPRPQGPAPRPLTSARGPVLTPRTVPDGNAPLPPKGVMPGASAAPRPALGKPLRPRASDAPPANLPGAPTTRPRRPVINILGDSKPGAPKPPVPPVSPKPPTPPSPPAPPAPPTPSASRPSLNAPLSTPASNPAPTPTPAPSASTDPYREPIE